MHVFGVVLRCFLYFVLAMVLLLFIDTMLRSRLSATTRFDMLSSTERASNLIVYLPGILADGITSSDPMRRTWQNYADVLCVSYGTERFDGEAQAKVIANMLLKELRENKREKLVLMLSSMGGILGLDIWNQIHDDPSIPSRVEMVVVDGIQGSENMLGGGNIAAPVVSLLPFGPIYNALLGPVFRKLQVPPKDPDIQEDLDKDKVKKEAMAAMAPYKISVWRDQLTYMSGHNDLYPRQFRGISRVYYLMCTDHNETVKQPNEMRKWQNSIKAAGIEFDLIKVPTPHCAYAQQPRIWNAKFDQVLAA